MCYKIPKKSWQMSWCHNDVIMQNIAYFADQCCAQVYTMNKCGTGMMTTNIVSCKDCVVCNSIHEKTNLLLLSRDTDNDVILKKIVILYRTSFNSQKSEIIPKPKKLVVREGGSVTFSYIYSKKEWYKKIRRRESKWGDYYTGYSPLYICIYQKMRL